MSASISYMAQEVAKLLNIGESTLRKWCSVLESEGYTFSRTPSTGRLFADRDIIVLRRLQDLVQGRKMALETAANIVVSIITAESQASTAIEASAPQTPSAAAIAEEIAARLDARFAALEARVVNQEQTAAAALPPSKEEQRQERVTELITERRIEKQLRDESLDEWAKAPVMKKAGWFRSEEDAAARDRFIQDYIDEHYESRILAAYGIEE